MSAFNVRYDGDVWRKKNCKKAHTRVAAISKSDANTLPLRDVAELDFRKKTLYVCFGGETSLHRGLSSKRCHPGVKVDAENNLKGHMVFWKGFWCEVWHREKLETQSTHKKELKRPYGFQGWFWVESREAKTWNATWLSGNVLGSKVDAQKKDEMQTWNATWLSGKVLVGKVDLQKKSETPHGFLRRLEVRSLTQRKTWNAVDAQKGIETPTWLSGKGLGEKSLTCHMVFWERSWCEVRRTKTEMRVEGWRTKKLETSHGCLERFLLGRSTYKKNLKRHMVFCYVGGLVEIKRGEVKGI